MSVVRNPLKNNYSLISNEAIEDERLSDSIFRMYCYICSRPDNWTINNADIKKRLKIKTDHTIARYWKELVRLNLIKRVPVKDSRNRFKGYDYEILPYVGQPHVDEPHAGRTDSGSNNSLNKTNNYNNTNINNTDNIKPQTEFSGDDFKKPEIEIDLEKAISVSNHLEEKEKSSAKKEKDDNLIYPFDTDNFRTYWSMWKEYKKKEFGFKFKTAVSEQAGLKKIGKLAKTEEEAIMVVEQAIEKGWKGFYPLQKDFISSSSTNETKSEKREREKRESLQRDLQGFEELANEARNGRF